MLVKFKHCLILITAGVEEGKFYTIDLRPEEWQKFGQRLLREKAPFPWT
jgi:hypothetical protein